MQNFVFVLLKLILIFFYASPVLSFIPSVDLSPDTKKYFFRLSVWNDEILSKQKITTVLAKSVTEIHETSPSNAIPWPLSMSFNLIALLTNLTIQNKQCLSEHYC